MKAALSRLTILVVLASSACGDDAAPSAPSDDLGSGTAQDAGRRDARVDAKASTTHDEDGADVAEMDDDDDVIEVDDDAGKTGALGDAGKMASDAGSRDASVPDAGHASTDAGSTRNDAGEGNTCDTLTYASFGQKFISNYCISCHGGLLGAKNIHLDTLAGVTSAKTKVKAQVSTNAMPPRGSKSPTSAERTQLSQWIDCGPK